MTDEQRTVLCFGDSNTHGTRALRFLGDQRRHPKGARWPDVMAKMLGSGWDVIAEGHPGRTTVLDDPIEGNHRNGVRVLRALLESHRPIDLVIIMLGTNDLKARFGMAAADVALGVQRLMVEVSTAACGPGGATPEILIAAPVRVTETGVFTEIFAGAQEKADALPGHLRHLAERHGVGFVDCNEVARVDPNDGVHLDARAHLSIGQLITGAVLDHLKKKGTEHAQGN